MKKVSWFGLSLALALPVMSGTAHAQFAKAEDAVKYRQSAFQLMASHFGRMQPVVRGQVPYDKAAIKANVDLLKTLSALPGTAFGAGMTGGAAKPEIWSDSAGFKKAMDNYQANLVKLSAAADAGDLDKLRAAFGDTGASCKACHDSYRAKK